MKSSKRTRRHRDLAIVPSVVSTRSTSSTSRAPVPPFAGRSLPSVKYRPRSRDPRGRMLCSTIHPHIDSRPLQWKLLLTLGAPTDPVNDATVPWPAERRVMEAGILTLTSIRPKDPVMRATSTSIRRCFLMVSSRLMIRCSAHDRRSTRRPIVFEPASLRVRLRSTSVRWRCEHHGGQPRRRQRTATLHRVSRILHWLTAILVFSTLLIGFTMVSTVPTTQRCSRSTNDGGGHPCGGDHSSRQPAHSPAPGAAPDSGTVQRVLVVMSEMALYALLLAQPLVGWAMVSAAGHPLVCSDRCIFPVSPR